MPDLDIQRHWKNHQVVTDGGRIEVQSLPELRLGATNLVAVAAPARVWLSDPEWKSCLVKN